jgi:membrane-bound serine protease (ClpP class)
LNILLDPNIVYFLFIGGLVLGVVAIFTPGTGFAELGAFFAVALAIYGFVNLPVNSWAITIMALGFIPFVFAGKKNFRKWLIPGSFVLVLMGSMLIFRKEPDAETANLLLIAFVDVIALALLWLYVIKGIEAILKKPDFDLNDLIGMETKAITDIHLEGTIHADGEDWTARSTQPISMGSLVRIVGRNGLVLIVEPADETKSADRVS